MGKNAVGIRALNTGAVGKARTEDAAGWLRRFVRLMFSLWSLRHHEENNTSLGLQRTARIIGVWTDRDLLPFGGKAVRIVPSSRQINTAPKDNGHGRRNWTFAGSDEGGRRAAAIYTLIATAKLNDIDPQAWLANVLARLPDHPAKRIHELLPWNWRRTIIAAEAA